MPETQRIDALAALAGRTVGVCGWVMTTRSSGQDRVRHAAGRHRLSASRALQEGRCRRGLGDARPADPGDLRRGDGDGPRRCACPRRGGAHGDGSEDPRARATIFRSLPKSTAPRSCSSTATCGCAAGGRSPSPASATRSSRRSATSSTSAASCWWTRRSSPGRSASTRGPCSPPSTSTWARPTSPRPASSTSRPPRRPSAKSTASGPPSAPRSPRPAAT